MKTSIVVAVLCGLSWTAPVRAQDDEPWEETPADEAESAGGEGEGETEGGDAEGEDAEGATEGEAEPAADAARQWYFGPYFRYAWVPAFMLEIFTDEAPTVNNATFGVAANYRPSPDGAAFEIGIGYAGYGFEDPFRAKGDPEEDTEWVESSLGLVHVTGSILWHTDLSEKFTFEYGLGLDLGILVGEMKRTEAYKTPSGEWAPCERQGIPNPFYCEATTSLQATDAYDKDGAHYDVVDESVPPIGAMPMLPHLTLRYEPIPDLAFKFEAAYGIVQFSLGLSAAYAPKL